MTRIMMSNDSDELLYYMLGQVNQESLRGSLRLTASGRQSEGLGPASAAWPRGS
jgi:hypothetical protein